MSSIVDVFPESPGNMDFRTMARMMGTACRMKAARRTGIAGAAPKCPLRETNRLEARATSTIVAPNAEPRVGTAGWALPAAVRTRFPEGGTLLERYAGLFSCVEINSTFYRPHRRATMERWAASVPDGFRFALKLPRTITHERRLVGVEAALDDFLGWTSGLGAKRDVLLVQLPPSLALDVEPAERFFRALRERYDGNVACEPRHRSWFDDTADALLCRHRVARVAADPVVPGGSPEPGGWPGLTYRRLHGSPQIYRSAYGAGALDALAREMHAPRAPHWCVFDNTAAGAATANAIELCERLDELRSAAPRGRTAAAASARLPTER